MATPPRVSAGSGSERRAIAEQIAADGGVMTLPGVPLIRHLVGELRWVEDNAVFWFTAFGDTRADGRIASFDEITVHPVGICFVHRGAITAFLAPIDTSAVEDPDDYRIAWQLWQEVRPLRSSLVEASFTSAQYGGNRDGNRQSRHDDTLMRVDRRPEFAEIGL